MPVIYFASPKKKAKHQCLAFHKFSLIINLYHLVKIYDFFSAILFAEKFVLVVLWCEVIRQYIIS